MTTPRDAIQKYLAEVKAVREKVPVGSWHIDCGVSQRSGWGIRNWAPGNTGRDLLKLNGEANIELDEKHGDVEEIQNFITQSPVTQEKLERALAIAVGALDDSEIEIDDRVRNKALADIARAIGEEQ